MSQTITFEKIVPEGKAMGHLEDGRAVFTIGPLPDEVAEVGIRKQKKSYAEAVLRKIISPSKFRSHPGEDHCITCSPWQGVDYSHQLDLKLEMLQEAFRQSHVETKDVTMHKSPELFGYRNRLDFSIGVIDGDLQLAFHERGSWDTLVALPEGCKLGSDALNAAALDLIGQLHTQQFDIVNGMITVRYAPTTGEILTILTTTTRSDWARITTEKLGNFLVCRPLPGSGAPGNIIYQNGNSYITEKVGGLDITYPYNGFFQTNTRVFEQALQAIIKATKGSRHIVELYSGAGSIGLPVAQRGIPVKGVEIVPESVEFAERNARSNKVETYEAIAVAAERMDASILEGADTIILDPPRAGLHPRVTNWIFDARPEQIIYLSCNPVTQARDIAKLQEIYELDSLEGYDMYPGTLHLEALAILKLKPNAKA